MRKKKTGEKSYPTIWIITFALWAVILVSHFISNIDLNLTVFSILIVLVLSAVIDWLLQG